MLKNNYLSVIWVGILAIILAISGPWFDLAVSNHSFVKTYIAGIGIGILVLAVLFKKQYQKEIVFHISYLKLFLGITFALGVLSIFWSTNPDFSITKLLIWVTIFMAFYVAYNLEITEENLRKLAIYLVIAATSIAIIGILQYLFDAFNPAGKSFGMTQAANPSSTFGNKNMATQPISMIFPLAVFLILNKNTSKKVLWIAGIGAALMVAFNFYTSTRASWIAISGEVILMSSLLIIKRKSFNDFASWNKYKTLVVAVSLALFFILINFNGDGFAPMWEKVAANFDRLTTDIQNDKSLRYQIWEVARQMVYDAPLFGTGLGTWFHNLVNEGYSTYIINYVQRVHNDLLELAVEIGLIGLGVFFLAVFVIIYALWVIITKADAKYLLFYFALFESLSGSFVNLQFSFPYQLAMPALLFGIWIGLIAKKSEEFIKPFRNFKFRLESWKLVKYKRGVIIINSAIFIIISSIYISWINMYSTLNKINMKGDFSKLEKTVETPIYHLEIQNIMNFLTVAFLKNRDYINGEKVIKQMLKYWPNDYVTMTRYAHILYNNNQYARAIEIGKKSLKISPKNSHIAPTILFNSYLKTKQYGEYKKLFEKIIKTPEEILAENNGYYHMLINMSLRLNSLLKNVPELYQSYYKYNSYHCGIEKNLLHYYILINNKIKMKEQLEKEMNNPNNCINKNIINTVKSKLKR